MDAGAGTSRRRAGGHSSGMWLRRVSDGHDANGGSRRSRSQARFSVLADESGPVPASADRNP